MLDERDFYMFDDRLADIKEHVQNLEEGFKDIDFTLNEIKKVLIAAFNLDVAEDDDNNDVYIKKGK